MNRLALGAALLSFSTAIGYGAPAGAQVVQPGFQQALVGGFGPGFGRTRAWGVGVADFTSDGIPDVVAGDFAGDVHLFEGLGDGTFLDRGIVIGMPFNDAYGLAVADFDKDGPAYRVRSARDRSCHGESGPSS
jgi:hypothetical protein